MRRGTRRLWPRGKRLRDDLEPRIRPLRAPDLRHRPALDANDVGGEVVRTAQQRRADAVHVRRNARTLEGADLVDGKAPRDDDSDGLETLGVERGPHLADEPLVHAAGIELTHLVPERAVDEKIRRVEPDTPQPRA